MDSSSALLASPDELQLFPEAFPRKISRDVVAGLYFPSCFHALPLMWRYTLER